MQKSLEIGENYGYCFGLQSSKQLIYRGGDNWEAINKETGATKVMESAKTTAGALEYINRPTVRMGAI